jgi:hypothetical protein
MSEQEDNPIRGTDYLADKLLRQYDTILGENKEYLASKGITINPNRPHVPRGLQHHLEIDDNGDPSFTDLTILSPEQLGQLFSFFANWTAYIQSIVSRVEGEKIILKKKIQVIESALKTALKGRGIKTADVTDAMRMWEDSDGNLLWVALDAKLTQLEIRHKSAERRHKDLRSSINAISREQTRRESEAKISMRERNTQRSNWDNHDNSIMDPKKSPSSESSESSSDGRWGMDTGHWRK